MKIIPAIDIIEGKCVRLQQGDYQRRTTYSKQPLEVAKAFEAEGLGYLHLVDLDGARNGSPLHLDILEQIVAKTSLKVDFGGGLMSLSSVQAAFEAGASQLNFGSAALTNPTFFLDCLKRFGAERIILSADSRAGKVAIGAWQETSTVEVLDVIAYFVSQGLQYVAATDIQSDGMLNGPALALYKKMLAQQPIKLIGSGGIRNIQDLQTLSDIGCTGAIIGKAIYEGKISLADLASFNNKQVQQ